MAMALHSSSSHLINKWSFPVNTLLSSSSICSPSSLGFLPFSTFRPNHTFFTGGYLSISTSRRPIHHYIVYANFASVKKKAAKNARKDEERRLLNRMRKKRVKNSVRKVLKALEALKKKEDAKPEELLPIEKLLGNAFSVIDKAVRKGAMHRNTGSNRKSKVSRRKRAVSIHHGWYTPPAPGSVTPTTTDDDTSSGVQILNSPSPLPPFLSDQPQTEQTPSSVFEDDTH